MASVCVEKPFCWYYRTEFYTVSHFCRVFLRDTSYAFVQTTRTAGGGGLSHQGPFPAVWVRHNSRDQGHLAQGLRPNLEQPPAASRPTLSAKSESSHLTSERCDKTESAPFLSASPVEFTLVSSFSVLYGAKFFRGDIVHIMESTVETLPSVMNDAEFAPDDSSSALGLGASASTPTETPVSASAPASAPHPSGPPAPPSDTGADAGSEAPINPRKRKKASRA